MSTADPNIVSSFGTDYPEDTQQSEFKDFDHNIGVLTGMKIMEFATNRQLNVNFRITDSIPTNKYRFGGLQYPAEPRYSKYVPNDPKNRDAGGSWEPVDDAAGRQEIDNDWAKGIAKLIQCFPINAPKQKEDLTPTFVETWGKSNEGTEVVFGAREKNGYVNVKYGKRADGKSYLVLSRADLPSKTLGLTNKEEAQQKIAKYGSKK